MARTALVVPVLLALGACHHASGPSNPSNKVEKSYASSAADGLGFLPVDSEVVMGADLQQLRGSGLWRQFEPKVMAKAAGALAKFKAMCGYDPVASVQRVAFGMKNLGDNEKPDGVIVVHGIDRDKTMACAAKAPGSDAVIDHGIVVTKDQKDGSSVVFTFVDASTGVMLIGPSASRDKMTSVLDAGAPLRTSSMFIKLYGELDPKASAWLLVNGNAKAFQKAAGMGFKFKAIYGTVTVTDGIDSTLRLRMDTADQAKQVEQLAQGQLQGARAIFQKLDIKAQGDLVLVGLAMTGAQVQMVLGQLGGMIGDDGSQGGGKDGNSDGEDRD